MPPRTTYTLSQLQDSFSQMYGHAERMKLERMGDVGMFPKPGKGALLPYTWEHVRRIVVAMELNSMGVPFAETARRFESHWKRYNAWCVKAERGGQGAAPPVFLYFIGRNADDEPATNISKEKLAELWVEYLSGRLPQFKSINLTMRLAAMKKVLEATPPRLRGRPPKASSATPETNRRAFA